MGTDVEGDHFGIVAEAIGEVNIGNALYAASTADTLLAPLTGDVRLLLVV
jgi:hypothetical protein